MKAKIPQPLHESYRNHRRQLFWQIILPIALSTLLCLLLVVLINMAAFREGGDVARWAAVSTIWIVIPLIIGLALVLALLSGTVYLMARLLKTMPTYTGLAQDYIHKAALSIQRGADAVVKPIFFMEGLGASLRAFWGRRHHEQK